MDNYYGIGWLLFQFIILMNVIYFVLEIYDYGKAYVNRSKKEHTPLKIYLVLFPITILVHIMEEKSFEDMQNSYNSNTSRLDGGDFVFFLVLGLLLFILCIFLWPILISCIFYFISLYILRSLKDSNKTKI